MDNYIVLYIFIYIGQLNFIKLGKTILNYAYIVVKMFLLLYVVLSSY